MLTITIPGVELFNEETMEFSYGEGATLTLEHSLISLSKWESIWHKPFLSEKDAMTPEETISYVKCMCMSQHVNEEVFNRLTTKNLEEIKAYIGDSMTATTFSDEKRGSGRREILTNEVIYGQMFALQIPFECQKWHLNRLLTLIKVCNLRNQPQKKMNKADILSRNARINAERKARLGTNG